MGTVNQLICKELCQCESLCSSIGDYISQIVVIQASKNIFHERHRSFIELVLNSVDAYRSLEGQSSVGKFGMGFYSIFEYILGYPDAKIIITSHTTSDHWTSTITTDNDNRLWYTIQHIPEDRAGTRIEIWSPRIEDMEYISLDYLRFISGVVILFNAKILTIEQSSSNLITIINRDGYVSNEDHATGISLNTYLQSMLVPGVSTKQIQHIPMPNSYLGPRTSIYSASYSRLDILIGEIPIISSNITGDYSMVIQMPSQTALPVSRDSFLPTEDNIRIYNQQVDYLIRSALHNDPKILYLLQKLVYNAYLKMKSPPWMLDHINHTVDSLPDQGIFYVSNNHQSSLNVISKVSGLKFVYVPDRDIPISHFFRLEDILSKQTLPWIDNMFQGKQVLILSDLPMISTNAGFGRFLFLKEPPIDLQKFILAYPEDGLVLFDLQNKQTDLYTQLLKSKLSGLKTYFDIFFDIKDFIDTLPKELHKLYYFELCVFLNLLIKHVIDNTSYTDDRPYLEFVNTPAKKYVALSPKALKYFEILIHDQFTYYKNNPEITLPNVWSKVFIPKGHVREYFLKITQDPYEYSILCILKYTHPDIQDDLFIQHSQRLLEYWRVKLNSSFHHEQIISWTQILDIEDIMDINMDDIFEDKHNNLDLADILFEVLQDLSTMEYLPYMPTMTIQFINEYTLSELLRRVYAQDFQINELISLRDRYPNTSQLIPIAVNQGISNPIEQCLTILGKTINHLDINIYHGIGEVIIDVQTSLSPEQILYQSLPYTKDFLPIYEISSLIETYYAGYVFQDRPIHKGGLVVDIQRTIYSVEGYPSGIVVHLPVKDVSYSILEASAFIKSTLTLNNPVIYHGEEYSILKHSIYETKNGKVWITEDKSTSWIMLNGIPYMRLTDYLDQTDMYPYDIKHQTQYQIVIDVDDPSNDELINYGIYYGLLDLLVSKKVKFLNTIISNITSYGDYEQTPMNPKYPYVKVSDFMELHNVAPDTDLNLANIINGIINVSDESPVDIPKVLKDLQFEDLHPLVFKTVDAWFAKKFKMVPSGLMVDTDLTLLTSRLQFFVNIWWEIFLTLNIPEIKPRLDSPTIILTDRDVGYNGCYDRNTHKITLNGSNVEISFDQQDIHWNELVADNEYIGNVFPASTLIHELYHAVLGSEHNNGHNDNVLTINGITKQYTFNAGAMEIYKEIILRDLVKRLVDEDPYVNTDSDFDPSEDFDLDKYYTK